MTWAAEWAWSGGECWLSSPSTSPTGSSDVSYCYSSYSVNRSSVIRRTTAAHERRIEMTLSEPEGLMYCDAVLNAKIRELHRVRAAEEDEDE